MNENCHPSRVNRVVTGVAMRRIERNCLIGLSNIVPMRPGKAFG